MQWTLHQDTLLTRTYLFMTLPGGIKKLMGSAGKGIGWDFYEGGISLFLKHRSSLQCTSKNNCTCAEGNDILQHKGKKEPSWKTKIYKHCHARKQLCKYHPKDISFSFSFSMLLNASYWCLAGLLNRKQREYPSAMTRHSAELDSRASPYFPDCEK